MSNGAMWCAARNPCDAGQVGADRGKIGGKDWQCRMSRLWASHSSHHFLLVRGLGADELNSILSTEIACRLRDV